MLVYGSSLSPYVRKVLVFAAEIGVDVENTPTISGSTDAEFREVSPFGKIPGLRDGDFLLSDSSAIVAYLDALTPGSGLLSHEPRARGKTIWWDEFADTILFRTVMKTFVNRLLGPKFDVVEWNIAIAEKSEREELPTMLGYLEASLGSAPFLVGGQITLADIAVASPLANLVHAGVRPDPSTYPKLARHLDMMFDRPSFASVLEKERAFLGRHGATGAW